MLLFSMPMIAVSGVIHGQLIHNHAELMGHVLSVCQILQADFLRNHSSIYCQ